MSVQTSVDCSVDCSVEPADALVDPALEPLDPADARPAVRTALRVWLRLQSALALDPMAARAALARWRTPEGALSHAGGATPVGDGELDAWVEKLVRAGVVVLPITCTRYPARLRELADAPPVLLAAGAGLADPALFERPAAAIVGARAATGYGLDVARALARALAAAGACVVSGLARGIDGAAHRGTLDGHGVGIAVQACGPDRVYPPEHRGLAEELRARGALLTELPPGTAPLGPYFPLRNRIISALARVVIVVEARDRSGSLITARHAADQGVDVMAVPGPIHVSTSRGSNRLLREGAAPLLQAADVLDVLGLSAARSEGVAPAARTEGLDPAAVALLTALRHAPASRDALQARTALPTAELALRLTELELAGLAEIDRDGRWRARGGGHGRE